MKRLLKWLYIGIGGLTTAAILLVLSGYLLPAETVLEVDETLAASPEAVFALLTTFDGVRRWWRQAAQDMGDDFEVVHLGGPTQGERMQVGFATAGGPVFESWTYTSVTSPRRIAIEVDFQIFESQRVIELTAQGAGTLARWRDVVRVDGLRLRWMVRRNAKTALENRRIVLAAAGSVAGR